MMLSDVDWLPNLNSAHFDDKSWGPLGCGEILVVVKNGHSWKSMVTAPSELNCREPTKLFYGILGGHHY